MDQKAKDALLASGFTEQQIAVLEQQEQAGAFTPTSIDQLPEPLKQQYKDRIAKAESDERERMHGNVKKAADDAEATRKLLEQEREERQKAERLAAEKAEQDRLNKLPAEQRLDELQKEINRFKTESTADSERQIAELKQEIEITRLEGIRNQLIAEAGGKVIVEMIPHPRYFAGLTEQTIRQYVEQGKLRYQSMEAEFENKYKVQSQQQQQAAGGQQQQAAGGHGQQQQQAPSYGSLPPILTPTHAEQTPFTERFFGRTAPMNHTTGQGVVSGGNMGLGVAGGALPGNVSTAGSAAQVQTRLTPEQYAALPQAQRDEYRRVLTGG